MAKKNTKKQQEKKAVCSCGNEYFNKVQLCYQHSIINSRGETVGNVRFVDAPDDNSSAPFSCTKCGENYKKLPFA